MAKDEERGTIRSWKLNDEVEMISFPLFTNQKREVIDYRLEYPDWVARMATTMVEKWGMVTAESDGEDTSGRAKLRLSTPDELVTRAVDTAEKLIAALRERGHVVRTPSYEEVLTEARGPAPSETGGTPM